MSTPVEFHRVLRIARHLTSWRGRGRSECHVWRKGVRIWIGVAGIRRPDARKELGCTSFSIHHKGIPFVAATHLFSPPPLTPPGRVSSNRPECDVEEELGSRRKHRLGAFGIVVGILG
eukprot:344824-Amorphochlora_amoeboformis.AAC.1